MKSIETFNPSCKNESIRLILKKDVTFTSEEEIMEFIQDFFSAPVVNLSLTGFDAFAILMILHRLDDEISMVLREEDFLTRVAKKTKDILADNYPTLDLTVMNESNRLRKLFEGFLQDNDGTFFSLDPLHIAGLINFVKVLKHVLTYCSSELNTTPDSLLEKATKDKRKSIDVCKNRVVCWLLDEWISDLKG